MSFVISSPYQPAGHQPKAIAALVDGVRECEKYQVLHGLTGSGKTRVMAEVIAQAKRPALILAPTKVLAHQTYIAFKKLLPHNAVELYTSDYIRFNPESYMAGGDSYAEKHAVLDPGITRQRTDAVVSLLKHPDAAVVVASVSAIFGIGSPETLRECMFSLGIGQQMESGELLARLDNAGYRCSDGPLVQGAFRIDGSCIEVRPPTMDWGFRIELANNIISKLSLINPDGGEVIKQVKEATIYPASVVITPKATIKLYTPDIRKELDETVRTLKSQGMHREARRLNDRTLYDIEQMEQTGYCPGIENYNRPLRGASPGATPDTLVSFFPEDAILFLDESHQMLHQIQAMYNGNYKRKQSLVEHGYRLPSAFDHRPLRLDELEARFAGIVCVTATPGAYELEQTGGRTVGMVMRPTYKLDPVIELKPLHNYFDDLLPQIRQRIEVGEQTLVMTATIKESREVADLLAKACIRCKAVHSELTPKGRGVLLDDLREGRLDVLVGIGLLREGLDLPRVSLVAILNAAKGGLHRSETDFLQMIGRAKLTSDSSRVRERAAEVLSKCSATSLEAADPGLKHVFRALRDPQNRGAIGEQKLGPHSPRDPAGTRVRG